jgi:pyruvate dehydrogenase E1 component
MTVMNETTQQRSLTEADLDRVRSGMLKGMYVLEPAQIEIAQVQLLGSGAILGEVQAAARMLKDDWNIDAAVWSVTSFTELHRDGVSAERAAAGRGEPAVPYVTAAWAPRVDR